MADRKAYQKAYGKEYSQRPEVKEKHKEYSRKYREKNKDLIEIKRKEYLQNPGVKERRKALNKEYRQIPEIKERDKKYKRTWFQKNKDRLEIKRKEYEKQPEVRERIRKNKRKNREKTLITNYKRIDKAKGFICDLTVEWMKTNITSKNCVYCQIPGDVGCDRIDNNKGHIIGNVVPCCYVCNTTKSDIFTYQQMIKTIGPAIRKTKIENDLNGLPEYTKPKGGKKWPVQDN